MPHCFGKTKIGLSFFFWLLNLFVMVGENEENISTDCFHDYRNLYDRSYSFVLITRFQSPWKHDTSVLISLHACRNESKLTTLNDSIVWPGGTTTTVTGVPTCGWNGEHCRSGMYHSSAI